MCVLADISVRSPRKILISLFYKNGIYWITVFQIIISIYVETKITVVDQPSLTSTINFSTNKALKMTAAGISS